VDQKIIRDLLPSLDAQGLVCSDIGELARRVPESGESILVSEEMLDDEGVDLLVQALNRQPSWSDLPILLVAAGGLDSPVSQYAMQTFTNVLLLDRPLRLTTLSSALRMAFRHRERQHRIRELLEERSRVEESLRESEERFRILLDASFDAVYRMSPHWDEMRQLQGREFIPDTDEPSSTWLAKYIHPADQPHVLEAIHEAITTKSTFALEHRVLRVDGTLGWVSSRAVPLLDAGGEIVEWIGAAKDVTESKEAEEAIRKLNESLERRVADRTQLAEERSKKLQALVAELTFAEQRERQRIAKLLHDHLQQLLVGAKINMEVLSGQTAPDRQDLPATILDLIEQAIQGTRSLTAELAPPVLQQGISASLEWLGRWFEKSHGFRVDLKTCPDIHPQDEDTTLLLYQSVRELLLNAVKHAGVRSARVDMSSDDWDRFRVTVSDEGSGFDSKAVGEREGTGFGLLSIRERLELLGGELSIRSSPGHGASFSLVLPMETRGQRGEKAVQRTPAKTRKKEADRERVKVLLVDDHAVVRQGLSAMLNLHEDVEVIDEASDGEEAIGKARELQPEVILMDVSMPTMDGIEATRHIRSELPHIRIIGLSMHDKQDLAERMIEAGASAYCTKDGDSRLLLSAIREVRESRDWG
jgi:signal transduction histidine kinase/CheY-like chemotaxis protein